MGGYLSDLRILKRCSSCRSHTLSVDCWGAGYLHVLRYRSERNVCMYNVHIAYLFSKLGGELLELSNPFEYPFPCPGDEYQVFVYAVTPVSLNILLEECEHSFRQHHLCRPKQSCHFVLPHAYCVEGCETSSENCCPFLSSAMVMFRTIP